MAQLQITLSDEKLAIVRQKVSDGEFASESDVVSEGIALIHENDLSFEQWVREVALPAYEKFEADPSTGMTVEQVRAQLAADLDHMKPEN